MSEKVSGVNVVFKGYQYHFKDPIELEELLEVCCATSNTTEIAGNGIFYDNEIQELKTYHVQMIHDNYDIKRSDHAKNKFPTLYKEIVAHDKVTTSSWYDLSNKAYCEYQKYLANLKKDIVTEISTNSDCRIERMDLTTEEKTKLCDCIVCTENKEKCPHKDAYRRMPKAISGLGLCRNITIPFTQEVV